MKPETESSQPLRPWVVHGSCTAEHEDFLIGDRPGLERLRRAIDDALRDGQGDIERGGIEFIGVRVVDVDPRIRRDTRPGGLRDAIACWVGGFVIFVLGMIFLMGLYQIWSWMK